jgi:hypothetical protein
MSDLQIETGFSILISKFAQLDCGLSGYHWLFITKLAWFSSLTHLSCLTVLRSHLYRFGAERLLRLLAMGGLATLLIVGSLSTGKSEREYTLSRLSRPAICQLWASPDLSGDDITFWSALVSVILIGVAFLSRVIELHKALPQVSLVALECGSAFEHGGFCALSLTGGNSVACNSLRTWGNPRFPPISQSSQVRLFSS